MVSTIAICNSALTKIGSSHLISTEDTLPHAQAVRAQLPVIRDKLLRLHPWNFAVTRANLARLSQPPAFGFAYQYQYPSDLLRLLSLYTSSGQSETAPYHIEGRHLLTNKDSVRIRYIRQVDDPHEMDSTFRELLALRLAADLAISVAGSRSLREHLLKEAEDALTDARRLDAQEEPTPSIPDGSWLEVR